MMLTQIKQILHQELYIPEMVGLNEQVTVWFTGKDLNALYKRLNQLVKDEVVASLKQKNGTVGTIR